MGLTVWVLVGGRGKATGSHSITRKEREGSRETGTFIKINDDTFFGRTLGSSSVQSASL